TLVCAICHVDLAEKRAVILLPCRHHFHASCARSWMEIRKYRPDQTCSVCRTRTVNVVFESGVTARTPYPFGETGQPTREVLERERHPASTIHLLLLQTQAQLSRCDVLSHDMTRGAEYHEDIQAEKALLGERHRLLLRMQSEIERGEWEGVVMPWELARVGVARQARTPEEVEQQQAELNRDLQRGQRLLQRVRSFLQQVDEQAAAAAPNGQLDVWQQVVRDRRERAATSAVTRHHGAEMPFSPRPATPSSAVVQWSQLQQPETPHNVHPTVSRILRQG
ncbi:hypothetical protein PMAYCL1PPCAC_31514, partial [Pristionchus mayeri]